MKIDLTNGKVTVPNFKVTPPGRRLANWLQAYGEYTASNEAPESFHLWVGLSMIAGALRRNVMMQMQHFDVLSNMFIVLVAPPGTARKTTALKIGRNILKEVPGVHFTTKAASPAALIKQFTDLPEQDQQSLTCISYELGTFFSTSAAEMVDITTDLYDGNPDWDKQTIGRGIEKITKPWLNFAAATTPQWLGDYMSPTAVEGGFVSRTVFIYEDQRKLSSPRPAPNPRLAELRRLLINDLTHISTLAGEYQLSQEAGEFYDDWYLDNARFPKIMDTRVGGYYERKHIHVLKVAMALAAAERDELVIQIEDIKTALTLLAAVEPGMRRSFSSVGRNIYATDYERILAQIAGNGGMTYGELVAANYHALDRKNLDDILSQLEMMNAIERKPGGTFIAKMQRM